MLRSPLMRRRNLSDPIEQRYRHRFRRFVKSSTRGFRKCPDRSRHESSSSKRAVQWKLGNRQRATILVWARDNVGVLGAPLPIRQSATTFDLRFANVDRAVWFHVSATAIRVPVSLGRLRDCIGEFECEPRRVVGGFLNDMLISEYAIVHPDPHTLWKLDVFDEISTWCANRSFQEAEVLIWRYGRGRFIVAALRAGQSISASDRCVGLELFRPTPPITSLKTIQHEHHFLPTGINCRGDRGKPAPG
jgi:hypothetical protein